jgi:hypothetical protein
MTPDTQQARKAFSRRDAPAYPPLTVAPGDSQPPGSAGNPGAVRRPSHAADQSKAATRAQEDAGIVGVIPLLAVLVVTVAGVYIAWSKGSAGGGEGGVVAGAALLVAAVARLLLPARAAGLLATRKRPNDVVTLAVFGIALLVAGAVLPR